MSTDVEKIMVLKKSVAGSTCRKCMDVTNRLHRDGLLDQINQFIFLDAGNPSGPGAAFAETHAIKTMPFFIARENGTDTPYPLYFKFKKNVFKGGDDAESKAAENAEIASHVARDIF
jgi:hypothetical protein